MSDPLYSLRAVRHAYEGRVVLQIPALTLRPGEFIAVIGPNGAGKSTLLRLLALLEEPTEGAITFHCGTRSVTAGDATIAERRQIAMLFQRPTLLAGSVRANIAYGLRVRGEPNHSERVDAVIARAGLGDLADAPVRILSGGQAQRAALARTMVMRPRVLLLDEPTAGLDPASVGAAEALIGDHHRQTGGAVALVTHNVQQARRLAERVILLVEGEIAEDAPAGRFFKSPRDPRAKAFLSGEMVY